MFSCEVLTVPGRTSTLGAPSSFKTRIAEFLHSTHPKKTRFAPTQQHDANMGVLLELVGKRWVLVSVWLEFIYQ